MAFDAEAVSGVARWIDAVRLPYELLEVTRRGGRRSDFYERAQDGDWSAIRDDEDGSCRCRFGVVPSGYEFQGGDTALLAGARSTRVYVCRAHEESL